MIPEFGHFALILAFALALVQGTLPLLGAARRVPEWMALARPAAQAQFVCLAIAFAALAYSFAVNDFSVLNVANNSNSRLPLGYRITASWGSHEGSLVLWMLMYSAWMFAVSVFSRSLPEEMVARVLAVMGLVAAGFLLFILATSNPFVRLDPPAADGRDLNPLLQDPGMAAHPPLLYMGYVGFSVAFSFAVAALIGGKLDSTWARWSRPWTTAAWCFLTAGIAVGSWWAYYELGWGGWWFWDPVENSSFMPWLAGTALIHSLAVTEKRGSFRNWTVLLAILAFSLSLLGTFLVRSGVLTSVHAFASDPTRGLFILGFLVLVIGGSLALFAWRASGVALGGAFELVSREATLLANNVLLVVAAGSVLLGTMYPLFLDALGLGKISVGPPYFDAVFVPLMTPALFLMGVGPLARWKEAKLPELAVRLRWAAAVSLASALAVPLLSGAWSLGVVFGLALGFWILAASAANLLGRAGGLKAGLAARLAAQPRGYYGMLLAHCGVAVVVLGITLVKGYEIERDLRLAVDDTATLGGYSFRFAGMQKVDGPNYVADRGTFEVTRNGARVLTLFPEKRTYAAQPATPMTEAAISPGFTGDVYVSLGEPLQGGAWLVRVYLKPFVTWIWGGAFLMALGGLLALSDRRYRLAARRERALPAGAALAHERGRP